MIMLLKKSKSLRILAHFPINLLNNVIKEGLPDSQISKKFSINRLKGQKIINNMTGPENCGRISEFCKNNYYSLVLDESTDCTVSKNLAVLIRIFDGECFDRFLELVPIDDSTANGIFNATMEILKKHNIPLQNMVGITTDNCNVMTGGSNGVQSKIKRVVPNVFTNGCICHILNLISYSASKNCIN